ncbi:MAG: helix-turn-helix transcriptional regulator [Clostridiales bacterium]|nr:helix-turn-helix transcriptional regulator [Clostridiales bacterium]
MNTADLIPFILLELKNGDKYGFELIKEIEKKSNGRIIIKQPTLYTVLKKLEKSKFISSYWEDSEIGGKRHYYKITNNGLVQTTTLPDYATLLANALGEEVLEQDLVQPVESPIPSEEVFNDNSVDSKTEVQANLDNTSLVKSDNGEEFAENNKVSKFTENIEPTEIKIVDNKNTDILTPYVSSKTAYEEQIEYIDFKDLKKDENYKTSKKVVKSLLLKNLLMSVSILALTLIFTLICAKLMKSSVFYIAVAVCVIFALFCPPVFISKYDEKLDKIQALGYNYNLKKAITCFSIFTLVVVIVVLIANIKIHSSFVNIFSVKNFANFYAPILLAGSAFLDILFAKLMKLKFHKE